MRTLTIGSLALVLAAATSSAAGRTDERSPVSPAALCAVLPRPTLRVRLVVERDVPSDLRPLVESTVTTVWQGEGLTVAWQAAQPADAADRSTHFWLRLTSRLVGSPTRLGDPTLGIVRFFGDLPHHDVQVSWAAAQDWARRERSRQFFSTFAGSRHTSLGFAGFDELARRAVALAAAHEVGHFVLGTKTHDGSGLMRRDLAPRVVGAVEDRDLVLSEKSRNRLRQRLAQGAACAPVVLDR